MTTLHEPVQGDAPVMQANDASVLEGQTAYAGVVQCSRLVNGPFSQSAAVSVLRQLMDAQPLGMGAADSLGDVANSARLPKMVVHDCRDQGLDLAPGRTRDLAARQVAQIAEDRAGAGSCPLQIDILLWSGNQYQLLLAAPTWCLDLASLQLIAESLVNHELPEPDLALPYADLLAFRDILQTAAEHQSERDYWTAQQDLWPDYRCDVNPAARRVHRLNESALLDPMLNEADEASLLVCWQQLLERHFGSAKIISCAVSPREIAGVQATIGPVTMNVPVAASSHGGLLWGRQQVREQLQSSNANCLFFADPESKGSGTTRGWRFGFSYAATLGACEVLRNDSGNEALRLSIVGEGPSRVIRITYDSWRYEHDDVRWLSRQFLNLLAAARRAPTESINTLAWLTDGDADWLIGKSRGPSVPSMACDFVSQFRRVCATHPDAPALHAGSVRLTYAGLDQWTNQIARLLQEEGVRAGQHVGICMPRTALQVATLLAVLKLGAAYVPIDPTLPAKRIATVVASANISLVTTDSSALDRVSELDTEVPLIDLERDAHHIAGMASTPLVIAVPPEQVAYLIFTSGSTGTPKGVAVPHRALMNYIGAIEERAGLSQYESLCALSTVAADLGYTAVFGALGLGRCLRLLDESLSLDAAALADALASAPVDCLKIVPSHLQALLAIDRPERVLPRKCLVFGGEALNWELVSRVQELAPGLRVLNHYGPTETTIGVICNTELTARGAGFGVPLGRPLGNCEAYVLDGGLRLTPVGLEGDVYLAGSSLAMGYFGQPAETAAKFIPNPYANEPGARLYVSGDRARWNGKGELCFLGRADHQVKLRGHRIELGEIESAIKASKSVSECAVVAANGGHTTRLVAYVAGTSAMETELRASLAARLPEHMVPTAWVWLDRLPLNANGKLDRRMLPDPDSAPVVSRNAANAVEATLLRICRELLGNERIGVDDNFFSVGADSIVAIQLVARARQAGYFFRPKQVFEQQTIARLSEVVQHEHESPMSEQGEVVGTAPLTAIQARFFALVDVDPQQYNQASLLDLAATIQLADLRPIVARLLAHHDGLRVCFEQSAEGSWQQRFLPVSPELVDRCLDVHVLAQDDADASGLAEIASKHHSSFDLTEAPLVRFVLIVDSGGANSKLLMIAHHLLVDTFSWQVIEEDLRLLLRAPAAALPMKTASMKQVAEQAVLALSTPGRDAELAYWQRTLNRVPRLPLASAEDRVGGARSRHVLVPATLARALSGDVHSRFNTNTQDFLLAALLVAMSPWSQSESIGIMLEGHGRDDEGLPGCDRTVGWFTAMFPLLLTLPNDFTTRGVTAELIMAVKEQIRTVPGNGSGYCQSLFLAAQGARVAVSEPELCFNYLGRVAASGGDASDAMAQALQAVQTGTRAFGQRRLFALEMLAMQFGDQLVCNLIYQPARVPEAVIDQLFARFEHALHALIDACSTAVGALTPSDVPDLNLGQDDLDALMSELSEVV
ncbi:hypothetical protein C7S18_08075 [Ahniella affigens]|uniref:Carrier domain-containing protein n=1 Tax=Ahniella affigens TaxID=2021234 RepID=A0A2P1PQP4_9GAMM|nr:non-ribosomal peptide synthetase [Ahniella affigens]AVP97152.1 hypothetical protein C7S18_08075 [Ahniella affigens]